MNKQVFKSKKEKLSLIDSARKNYSSYPQRLLSSFVKKLDEEIKTSSYEGGSGAYLNIKNIDSVHIIKLKEHYESEGFEVEITDDTFWVWWVK